MDHEFKLQHFDEIVQENEVYAERVRALDEELKQCKEERIGGVEEYFRRCI
jgi:hypothetical protein